MAGVTFVNVTAHGLPSGAIAPSQVIITLAPTCAAGATGPVAGAVTATPTSVTFSPLTGADRIHFELPASLNVGSYFASIVVTNGGGTPLFSSTTCSIVTVTHSNATLNACVPTSSLAVSLGTTVTAYVPNGAWNGSGTTGIQVVPIEGPGALVSVATPQLVNSCSSNPATGETVCTANTTDVYLLSGASLTGTLTSGATGSASFTGGSCQNCGVAINALANTAYITEGNSSASSGSGIQTLNLASNTFGAPVPATHVVSEDISVDPTRSLLLSAGEDGFYDLFALSPSGAITTEFGMSVGGTLDSSAEDCTTGIALATSEFTGNVVLSDLTQATFNAATKSWTAPTQTQSFPEFGGLAAGTSGISVAPGSSHLGVVAGEFGGNTIGAILLPPTSGSGTPAVLDYAYATMPNTPDGNGFSNGFDPHTVTAYTSPNNGRAYAVVADWTGGVPVYVGIIDLQAFLAATRTAGTHTIDPAVNLIATGVVRYVPAH